MAAAYKPNTILRFYEVDGNDEHYSAVILKDGRVMELKSPHASKKKEYESIDAWRESLPGQPALENITVDEKKEEREVNAEKKEKKPKKAAKAAKKVCNVPSRKEGTTTRYWPIHVHTMMKEANPALLEREDVIDAYNRFVEGLDKYDGLIYTMHPPAKYRYTKGIKVEKHGVLYNKICLITNQWNAQREITTKDLEEGVHAVYNPLYELIKREVVPYVEKKEHEKNVEDARKQSIKDIQRIKELEVRYAEQYQTATKYYEQNMKYVRDAISQISRRLDDVMTSFRPTIFDA